MLSASRAEELIRSFPSKSLLVIGDVILDKFIYGSVTRQSPEAEDCPVLDFEKEFSMLGGAANVAANLRSLGCREVRLIGITGNDDSSLIVQRLLHDAGIINHLYSSVSEPTITKVRFVSNKHLLRFDTEPSLPLPSFLEFELCERIRRIKHIDGIILQDYDKGIFTPSLVECVMQFAQDSDIPVFVDPKQRHWSLFKNADIVKPNLKEARIATGQNKESNPCVLAKAVRKITKAKAVIVTAGSKGMALSSAKEMSWSLPRPVEVVDVSGAGDAVISALALSRLSGASMVESMSLANAAAGISASKRGTAVTEAKELLSFYNK